MADTLKDAVVKAFAKGAILNAFAKLRKDKTAMSFLSGYRTYIMAAALLSLALLSAVGIDVPLVGHVDPGLAVTDALGLIFARKAVTNTVAKLVAKNDLIPPHTDH